MSDDEKRDLSGYSLRDLFRTEAESQVQILTEGLLTLERDPGNTTAIEPLMRAAHSLKGAARIVELEPVVRLAHVMEDCLVAAQKGRLQLTTDGIDRLLAGVDLISQIANLGEAEASAWLAQNELKIVNAMVGMYDIADRRKPDGAASRSVPPPASAPAFVPASPPADPPPAYPQPIVAAAPARPAQAPSPVARAATSPDAAAREDRVLRVSASNFDRLLSLASESRIAAHAMHPYLHSMQRFKKSQHELFADIEGLQQMLASSAIDESFKARFSLALHRINPLKQFLVERLAELESYERRLLTVSQQTLDEVLTLRMRPFRDGVHGFPRMVRDLARRLGKEVRLKISGEDTLVDRDILARMESPLNHILRNAIDHGMETPEERLAAGKPAQGTIRLDARHAAGMLSIQVTDDGRGAAPEKIRQAVIDRNMASRQMAADLSQAELLDFLFLPAFSLKETANELSGRGVGLDVVHATIRQLHGTVKLETEPGQGFRTYITLPLSQSIIRAVVLHIGNEAYAIPIAKIERILTIASDAVHTLEDKQFFTSGKEHIGLIPAAQLLELDTSPPESAQLAVVVIGSGPHRYGLVVDAIIGEHSLAVQPLDGIFGKLQDVSAAALLDDGSPVLILDVADLLIHIEKALGEGGLQRLKAADRAAHRRTKRVLVVDDSLTVREMERKLLHAHGYDVEVAVDGMDGWNAVRSGEYDLVITDVDMPRMDGIELVNLIKKDSRLQKTPVMIVSYKDRPEDRARGIDAGADYYLTKGGYHDETLLEAVFDLIGEGAA